MRASPVAAAVLEELRVLVVAGITVGVVVAGVGSRLAMLILRFTSPDGVLGVTSDDGFTIGRVTLAGTYNLLVLGALVGIIGAAAYRWVAPWLLGPTWFRRVTVGLASGAVVGSMLLHADGIDFVLLQPTWLAMGLFIVLPGLFGVVVGVAVDRVEGESSWTARGRIRWLLPVALVACFPPVLPVVAVAGVVLVVWVVVRRLDPVQRLRASAPWAMLIRVSWLGIAVLGLVALVADVRAIA